MSTTELILKNEQTVKVDTKLTLGAMRRAFDEKALSQDMLVKFGELMRSNISGVEILKGIDISELFGAPYIAYINANPDGMSRDEFEELLDPDISVCGQIYGEIMQNLSPKQTEMSDSFKKATKKPQGSKNGNKKKYQK